MKRRTSNMRSSKRMSEHWTVSTTECTQQMMTKSGTNNNNSAESVSESLVERMDERKRRTPRTNEYIHQRPHHLRLQTATTHHTHNPVILIIYLARTRNHLFNKIRYIFDCHIYFIFIIILLDSLAPSLFVVVVIRRCVAGALSCVKQ